MKYATALFVKFITCVISFAIGLDLFFDATFLDILSFSLFATIVSYIVGDRIVLPHFGQRAATAIDFLLIYVSVWIFGAILLDNYLQIAWGSIISATLITAVEVFVHRYLLSDSSEIAANERQQGTLNRKLAYGTEFAEDQDVRDKENNR
ncbi:YndM family protein [Bacillus sp. V59.32b]|uniref:YndM family protein n=1 Tax=Bacillus sp. V59.32b TaxID=1758642 RepID=UPI0020B108A6|nr:YndM family protein [Bacillus sp. V59.32b]